MKTAGVAEVKARLSHYLDRVKGGEEWIITDRGTPVARLTNLASRPSGLESLRDLERQGGVKLPKEPPELGFLREPPVQDPTGRALRVVLEEREDGW